MEVRWRRLHLIFYMAISFVGTRYNASSSVTVPTHVAGDILIFSARRNNSTTPPTVPGDITVIFNTANGSADRPAMSWGWKRAASASETSGTWTNASSMFCSVYRGCKASGDVIGTGKQQATNINQAAIAWPSVTFDVTDGSSWGISFGAIDGTISGDADINANYGNMTNRNTSTVNLHTHHDSNGGVTGITGANSGALSSRDYNVTGFELLAEPPAAFTMFGRPYGTSGQRQMHQILVL